jgi:hypothetical protein
MAGQSGWRFDSKAGEREMRKLKLGGSVVCDRIVGVDWLVGVRNST